MNPATPTISAPTTTNTEPEAVVYAVRPEISPMDYANFTYMSAKEICEHIGLKHSNKVILFVIKAHTYKSVGLRNFAITIASYFNPTVGYAYPSQRHLCAELGATRQTISKWTKELAESGYWAIERGHEGKANRFTFPFVEFAHLRAFMAAESQGEQYIKGLFPTVVSESKRGTTRVARPAADDVSQQFISPTITPVESVRPDAMPQPEVLQEQPAREAVQEMDAPAPPQAPKVTSDDELLAVVQRIVDAGYCLDEADARGSVRRALIKEREKNPTLTPSQLEDIATAKLINRIGAGLWTKTNDELLGKLVPTTPAPIQESNAWDSIGYEKIRYSGASE